MRGYVWSLTPNLFFLFFTFIRLKRYYLFLFLFFWGLTQGTWHMKVPWLGTELELQLLACTPCHSHSNSAAACSNLGSLTHWVRAGIELTAPWVLAGFVTTDPRRELQDIFFFTGVSKRTIFYLSFLLFLIFLFNFRFHLYLARFLFSYCLNAFFFFLLYKTIVYIFEFFLWTTKMLYFHFQV